VILFARTRHHYDSYRDFFRLVEAAQFATCFVDEIRLDEPHIYIFTPMNGEVLPHLRSEHQRISRSPAARVIWWNLERPEDETLSASLDKLQGFIDDIWVSDRFYAKLDRRFTYVPVAGHKDFGTRSDQRDWDVCTLAYLWGRRRELTAQLEQVRYKITPEAWGRSDQDKFVAKSHLMLNMHQYDGMQTIAPIRFAVAASYAIPIVSEPFADICAQDVVHRMRRYDQLVQTIDGLFALGADRLAEAGRKLHQMLCVETDFSSEVARRLQK
jgi:hypothetical protein